MFSVFSVCGVIGCFRSVDERSNIKPFFFTRKMSNESVAIGEEIIAQNVNNVKDCVSGRILL